MRAVVCGLAMLVALASSPLRADDVSGDPGLFDQGKLLATGGVSQIEGAGGGGLANWALITGYGTRDGLGANAHYTTVLLPDYRLDTLGVAVGLFDRVELSYAWQSFDTQAVGAALGLGRGYTFHQNIYGAKVRLAGNAVYDQNSWLPQIAVGVQHKENDRGAVIAAMGGKGSVGTDFYLSATKLFLAQSLLVSATMRATRANQFGILGFGGDKHGDYSAQFEGSAAWLLSRHLALGAELRTRPSNLKIVREGAGFDFFAAWFVNKHLSATLAYADLGNIAIRDHQHGAYLSLQAGL
jgi:hypothetical protein